MVQRSVILFLKQGSKNKCKKREAMTPQSLKDVRPLPMFLVRIRHKALREMSEGKRVRPLAL
jgi:hypothetical protein